MVDLLDIGDDWLIKSAEKGDLFPLADAVRAGDLRPRVREFVAAVLLGEIELKRVPKKSLPLTSAQIAQAKERHVDEMVNLMLSVEKWSKTKGTTVEAVVRHIERSDGDTTSNEAQVLHEVFREQWQGIKTRDEQGRDKLTREFCKLCDVKEADVEAYRNYGRKPPSWSQQVAKLARRRPRLRPAKSRV